MLAEMHSERESGRRLWYSKHNIGNSITKVESSYQGRDTLHNDDYNINNYPIS